MNPTDELLKQYHAFSHSREHRMTQLVAPKDLSDFLKIKAASRELVSRCILNGDPRILIDVIIELSALMRVLGQEHASDDLHHTAFELYDYYAAHKDL